MITICFFRSSHFGCCHHCLCIMLFNIYILDLWPNFINKQGERGTWDDVVWKEKFRRKFKVKSSTKRVIKIWDVYLKRQIKFRKWEYMENEILPLKKMGWGCSLWLLLVLWWCHVKTIWYALKLFTTPSSLFSNVLFILDKN